MAEDTVEGNAQVLDHGAFRDILGDMTSSVAAARESVKKLSAQYVFPCQASLKHLLNEDRMDTDTKDGISLLSLKHHLMLSYCQGLVLLSTHRILGHSLNPSSENDSLKPFGAPDRGTRGSEPSDLVNSLVEKRVVLEKVKALESKMRYQIDKLVRRAAEPDEDATKNVIDGQSLFSHSCSPQLCADQTLCRPSCIPTKPTESYEPTRGFRLQLRFRCRFRLGQL